MSPAQTPVLPSASTSPSAELPPEESRSGGTGDLLRRFWPFLAVAIFAGALAVLHRELAAYRFADIRHSLRAVSPDALAQSVLITALAYAVLPGYDAAALRYVGSRLPLSRVALGSFIAYAFSQTLGFPLLTGGSVRYRLWSAWGLSSVEIAEAVSFLSFSFALGMVEVSGIVFVLAPGDTAALLHLPFRSLFPIGVANLTLVAVYAAWSLRQRGSITVGRWALPSVSPTASGRAADRARPRLDPGRRGAVHSAPAGTRAEFPHLSRDLPAGAVCRPPQPRTGWAGCGRDDHRPAARAVSERVGRARAAARLPRRLLPAAVRRGRGPAGGPRAATVHAEGPRRGADRGKLGARAAASRARGSRVPDRRHSPRLRGDAGNPQPPGRSWDPCFRSA